MDIGDTFLLKDRGVEQHFWVVISLPDSDPERVVIVNITTHNHLKDGACILDRSDHDWIRHESSVAYSRAKCVAERDLDSLTKCGQLVPNEPASDEMIRKIHCGAELTDSLPNKCRNVLIEQELIAR